MSYAGFWVRFLASLIDALVTSVAFGVLVALVTVMGLELAGMPFIYLAIAVLYGAVMQSSARQATYGKALLGLKVTGLEGERISLGRALGREIAKIISTLTFLIGYIIAAFTTRKQALHDFIGSTLVVRASPGYVVAALAVALLALFAPFIAAFFLGAGMIAGLADDLAAAFKAGQQVAISAQTPKPAAAKPQAVQTPPPAAAPKAVPVAAAAPSVPAPAAPPAPAAKPVAIPAAAPVVLAQAPAEPAKPMAAEPPKEEKPKPVARKPRAKPAPTDAAKADEPAKPKPEAAAQEPPKPVLAPAPPMAAASPKFNDLTTAILYGDTYSVQQLIAHGKWPDKPDSRGVTPLMVAAQVGDRESAEALLKAGANPNRPGPGGETAMSIARERKDAAMIGLLQRYGGR